MLSEPQREELEEVCRETVNVRVRERLQAVRMASSGQYTQEEIATVIRRTLQSWLEAYRAGGVDKLLARRKPGASRSPCRIRPYGSSGSKSWRRRLSHRASNGPVVGGCLLASVARSKHSTTG